MDYTLAYDPEVDFDRWYTIGTGREVATWVRPGDRVLELGCATGLMTAMLVEAGARVTAVDRAGHYLERVRDRALPGVDVVAADLADGFPAVDPHEHVLATSILHQIPDPAGFVAQAAERLAPGGLLHVTVPNPRSLHRLVAVDTGHLSDLDEISALGHATQVTRMMSGERIVALGRAAGLQPVHRGGVLLKPAPNGALEALPDELLETLLLAARHAPDLAAMSYVVLRRA
ncbi:class I SAM-dependent methyltransferase [Patulibacter sp. SYSU D01012]|uniref:class I SAM-dependent methyltransferase n=1 Tax=Patulibacter sp. SYSU D01012 TaxID=2817381 RepID=UPI001B3177EC|nr:class I SAM-dependent methyltransferase [Patulibacter sp. SYSU D01012]